MKSLKLNVASLFVTFLGSPGNMPTLSFAGSAREYGTVYSATLEAEADYFVAANIIIKVAYMFHKLLSFSISFHGFI